MLCIWKWSKSYDVTSFICWVLPIKKNLHKYSFHLKAYIPKVHMPIQLQFEKHLKPMGHRKSILWVSHNYKDSFMTPRPCILWILEYFCDCQKIGLSEGLNKNKLNNSSKIFLLQEIFFKKYVPLYFPEYVWLTGYGPWVDFSKIEGIWHFWVPTEQRSAKIREESITFILSSLYVR